MKFTPRNDDVSKAGALAGLDSVAALVRRTGQWFTVVRVAAGVAWSATWFAGVLALAAAWDCLLPLPVWARAAAALAAVLPAVLMLAVEAVVPLLRPPSADRVARLIERALGRMHNRLLSCLDLLRPGAAAGSARFQRRLIEETVARLADFRPARVVNMAALRRAAAGLGIASVALALLHGFAPVRSSAAFARLCRPFADLPPVGDAAYWVAPATCCALRGDDLTIEARVTCGKPAALNVRLRDDAGRMLLYPMVATSGVWRLTLTGFEHSFAYRVEGGGTWSPRYYLTLLDRPALLQLQTVLHYPPEMGDQQPFTNALQFADVRGPAGSRVEIRARVAGDAASGVVRFWQGPAGLTNAVATMPLARGPDGLWAGAFPLNADGGYVLEFRNAPGHTSKSMRPGVLTALPDAPPQVAVERPGRDLVVSQPLAVSLMVSASDDYGLRSIRVLAWHDKAGASGAVVVLATNFTAGRCTAGVAGVLDLAALGAGAGDTLRYVAIAEDLRRQTNRSPDYAIRLATGQDAADLRLSRFGDQTDQFSRRLTDLLAAQAGMTEAMRGLDARYGVAVEYLRSNVTASANAAILVGATQDVARLVAAAADSATTRQLDELRRQLEQVATRQMQTVSTATLWLTNFMAAAASAQDLPLLPSGWSGQMQTAAQAWERAVTAPMARFAQTLAAGAQAGGLPPSLAAAAGESARLQRDLQRMHDEARGMTGATYAALTNGWTALDALSLESTRAQANAAERELGDLALLMETMNGQLRQLSAGQQLLLAQTPLTVTGDLTALILTQQVLEARADATLRDLSLMQGREELWALRHTPAFPDAPYTPDAQPGYVPPREEDPVPATSSNAASRGVLTAHPLAEAADSQDEPLYMPALGGPPPALDQRYAEALRPLPPSEADGGHAGRQRELQQRQSGYLSELDMARQSVDSDRQSLQQTLERLQQGWQGSPAGLAALLQSAAMRQAMTVASRAPWPSGMSAASGMLPQSLRVVGVTGDDPAMAQLDPQTRAILLRMQPVQREEILQGLRETGPASYRSLIRNYFRQLTEAQQ